MENASKALLMAAGVLIGVLIISLAVYLMSYFGGVSADIHKQQKANQINQFNSQFTAYEGKDCTVYDAVTLANLAKSNNENYSLTSASTNNYYITVKLSGKNIENMEKEELDNIITKEMTKMITDEDEKQVLPKYSCTVTINPKTQRVQTVVFKNK